MPRKRLETGTAPETEQVVAPAIDHGDPRRVLDLSEKDHVSGAGLRVFLRATKQLKKKHGAPVVCPPTRPIRHILDIGGFVMIMPCYPTLEDAIRALGA